jgi:hypothetical protein
MKLSKKKNQIKILNKFMTEVLKLMSRNPLFPFVSSPTDVLSNETTNIQFAFVCAFDASAVWNKLRYRPRLTSSE